MSAPRLKQFAVAALLSLLVGSLLSAALLSGLFANAQLRSTDFLFTDQTESFSGAIVIVGIDQRSYRELLPQHGPLVGWSRALYGQAVDRLRSAGARVIALDMFFDAPRAEDSSLIDAISRTGNVVFPVEGQGPGTFHPRPGVVQVFDVFVRSTPRIAAAAVAEGSVNVTTDRDTVVRSLPLVLESSEGQLPSLSLAIISRYVRRANILDQDPTSAMIYAAGRTIPVVNNGRMLINYSGPPSLPGASKGFPIIPFVDVISGSFDESLVRDKIVLLGLTIRGIDEFATPTTSTTGMWGVEVQASAVDTLLAERYLLPASRTTTVLLIYAAALTGALFSAAARPLYGMGGVAASLLLYLVGASMSFDRGVLLNMVYPPAAVLLGFTATQGYRIFFEQAQRQLVQDLMSRYLSPSVSQWVLQQPEQVKLGGETRVMTVLFCDLRGFTLLSRSVDPHLLVSFVNDFMTAMTDVIFRHDGVLDKYIGDEVMAFWNAPRDQPDHASLACQTALEMVREIDGLRSSWSHRGLPPLDIGVGINTGPMVVGNMGSRERLAYTVIGDAVNVASRLQNLNKQFGTHVLTTESTRKAAGDRFVYRAIDQVTLRGHDEPLAVYELLRQDVSIP
ncbi:MAG TPA: adenylate/guanylate cyclase domain-containing protein [Nitrospira sp.]|nr:adenylate/guanylate cyclase domain-containing protein [Nitrospira sp.]